MSRRDKKIVETEWMLRARDKDVWQKQWRRPPMSRRGLFKVDNEKKGEFQESLLITEGL